MARRFLTSIDLAKNELQNAKVQNLGTPPAAALGGDKGLLYMNSTDNTFYWWNGATWVSAAGAALVYGTVVSEMTFGLAAANGVATSVARGDHTHGSPAHGAAAHSTIPVSSFAPATGTVDMGSQKIINVADPTLLSDAANKGYVDNSIAGLAWKDAVRLASTVNIALSGLAAVDGVTPVAGDRILVKNHTFPEQCGIYTAAAGAWTRTLDANAASEMEAAAVFVMEGATLQDTAWVCTTNAPIVLGTTPLTFVQFSGAGPFLPDHSVTNIKLAQVAQNTIKGRYSAGTGDVEDLNSTMLGDLLANRFTEFREFNVGDGTSTFATVAHNLNTRAVLVEVFRNSTPWERIDCDVERPTVNEVTLRFAVAPTAAQYTAIVVG